MESKARQINKLLLKSYNFYAIPALVIVMMGSLLGLLEHKISLSTFIIIISCSTLLTYNLIKSLIVEVDKIHNPEKYKNSEKVDLYELHRNNKGGGNYIIVLSTFFLLFLGAMFWLVGKVSSVLPDFSTVENFFSSLLWWHWLILVGLVLLIFFGRRGGWLSFSSLQSAAGTKSRVSLGRKSYVWFRIIGFIFLIIIAYQFGNRIMDAIFGDNNSTTTNHPSITTPGRTEDIIMGLNHFKKGKAYYFYRDARNIDFRLKGNGVAHVAVYREKESKYLWILGVTQYSNPKIKGEFTFDSGWYYVIPDRDCDMNVTW